jgi:hypothetical protein
MLVYLIPAEVLTLLLRNSEYCGYCTSGGRVVDNMDDAETKFNQVSHGREAGIQRWMQAGQLKLYPSSRCVKLSRYVFMGPAREFQSLTIALY